MRLRFLIARDKASFASCQLALVTRAGDVRDPKALFQALRPLRPAGKRVFKPWTTLSVSPALQGEVPTFQSLQDAKATFFGAIEAGVPSSPAEVASSAQRRGPAPAAFTLQDLPTLLQVECLARATPDCKAPGTSGLPNYFWTRHPTVVARHLHPLFVKSHVRLSEPVQFKDVSLVTLFKGKGMFQNLANHRAICLMETPGKMLRKQLRPALLEALGASDMHQGGIPGSLLQAGQHIVRTFMAVARARGMPHAAYFLDVSSAYYRVIRCALSDLGETDAALLAVLHRLRVPSAYLQEVIAWSQGACLLQHTSPHIRAFIAQTLQGTHFRVQHGSFVTQTHAGVRPGDALADALFSFVQADFLRALELALTDEGFFQGDALEGSDLQGRLIAPTWADDTVPLVAASDCHALLSKLRILGSSVHRLLHGRGLLPNYHKGKTEVVIALIGPAAHSCRQELMIQHGGLLSFTAADGPIEVRCVPSYTHLGGRVHFRGGVLPDIMQKAAAAYSAVQPLRRSVFRGCLLPLGVKRQILHSLAVSRLAFSAPTWGRLNITEAEGWRKAWTRLHRFLLQDDRWTGKPTFPDTASVCAAAGVPSRAPFLRAERLKHFVRVACALQETLISLLRWEFQFSADSWLHLLREDLLWASRLVDLPAASLSDFPDGLLQFALDSPASAHRLFRLAAARASHECVHPVPEEDIGVFHCGHCAAQFTTSHRLSVHMFAVHGVRSAADSVASGTHCPACLRQYWTRPRLVRHLQHNSPQCLQLLLEHGMQPPPLSAADRARLCSDRKEVAHLPACRLAGPLLPLSSRTLGEVMVEAQELLASCQDPGDLEAAAPSFRASFFPTPAICDALEGLCDAFGFVSEALLHP